jgi:type I restriction-modification system DNA methylase subunit
VNHQNLSSFIWSVADLLRGDYKQSDYNMHPIASLGLYRNAKT